MWQQFFFGYETASLPEDGFQNTAIKFLVQRDDKDLMRAFRPARKLHVTPSLGGF